MNKKPYDYIRFDLAGYPFNGKYPGNGNRNSELYHGYRNNIEETFFYDFAVQRYDLKFEYKGKTYYFMSEEDHAALCDENFTHDYQCFMDGNDVIEKFLIDGKSLLELIPEIKNCEAI